MRELKQGGKSMSIDFYNKNAQTFIEGTINSDLTSLYRCFLPLLHEGAHILDAGCGSGRDSKAFLANGFKVTAIDASSELASAASLLIGQKVDVCLFQQFTSRIQFDAIWACASLLHVPSDELNNVFQILTNTLKPEGLFYCSFKYGNGDVERDGRYFTNMDEDRLNCNITNLPLHIVKLWVTTDVRPGREQEKWLNVILKKEELDV